VNDDTVPVDDRGLNYGDGLFETIRVQSGEMPLLSRHLSRLEAGCRRIGLAWPGRDELGAQLSTAVAGMTRGVVKLVLTRGSGGRGYAPPAVAAVRKIISCHALPDYPPENYTLGIRVRMCGTRLGDSPDTAGLKHLGRLEQVLASMEPDEGAAEGLMQDAADRIVEGIRSNLFLVRDGGLVTPDLTRGGVAGVMRAEVLDIAARAGIPVRVTDISLSELRSAREAILTSSIFGIWPVREIARVCEFESPGPMGRRLMAEISRLGVRDWAP